MNRRAKPELTRAHQEAFLAAFAKVGVLTKAAEAAKVNPRTIYTWKHDDEAFAKAFDEAEQAAFGVLVAEAVRRGAEGYNEWVVSAGQLVTGKDGEPVLQRRYSDQLLKFLIERREGKPVQPIEHSGEVSQKPDAVKPAFVAEVLAELNKLGGLPSGEDSAV